MRSGDFFAWSWRSLLPFLPILEQAVSVLEYEGFAGCGIILQLPLLHQYFPIPAPKGQTSLLPDILL